MTPEILDKEHAQRLVREHLATLSLDEWRVMVQYFSPQMLHEDQAFVLSLLQERGESESLSLPQIAAIVDLRIVLATPPLPRSGDSPRVGFRSQDRS